MFAIVFAMTALLSARVDANPNDEAEKLYVEHCSKCHHVKRLGQEAPPLLPTLYSKSVKNKLAEIISNGLPATQMPPYKEKLTKEQIDLLVGYIQTPIDKKDMTWTDKDILASRKCVDTKPEKKLAAKMKAYLEEITLVMERGTKSLDILSGSELTHKGKFFVGSVHGGPKFSYSLEDVFAVSRDGRVTKYNIPRLTTDCTVKAGINTRSIAVSHDDKIIAVANYLPQNIVFFNDNLEPIKTIDLPGKAGGFYSVPNLKGFILSFRNRPEIWIIRPGATPEIEKIAVPAPFEDFSISPLGQYLLGTKRGSDKLFVYDYIKQEVVATLPTSGMPHLASATFWINGGKDYAGVNHIKEPHATIISLTDLKIVTKIALPGAGFFVRTHWATPYLWIDTETDRIVLVDKNDFTKIRYITPHKGKKAMHVEFTKNGRYALVTIPGENGEVVVYDTILLEKIRTIPYNRPVGKYNATNKTYPKRAIKPEASIASATEGKRIFDNYCMGCHHQIYEAFGPPFAEIAATRSEEEIRSYIKSPKKNANLLGYEGSSMSEIKLDDRQLDAIVSYVLNQKQE